jgi:hypothetical protein
MGSTTSAIMADAGWFKRHLIREFGDTWYCRRCRCERGCEYERGKPKVRMLGSGFVTVFLSCGHSAAVNQDRV